MSFREDDLALKYNFPINYHYFKYVYNYTNLIFTKALDFNKVLIEINNHMSKIHQKKSSMIYFFDKIFIKAFIDLEIRIKFKGGREGWKKCTRKSRQTINFEVVTSSVRLAAELVTWTLTKAAVTTLDNTIWYVVLPRLYTFKQNHWNIVYKTQDVGILLHSCGKIFKYLYHVRI